MRIEVDIDNWKQTDTNIDLLGNIEDALDIQFEENVSNGDLEDYPKFTVKEILEDWKSKYMYLAADFDNYKKDTNKKMKLVSEETKKEIINKMLNTLDNFDLALKVDNANQGLIVIYNSFIDTLNKLGLEEYAVEIGQPIDDTMNVVNITQTKVDSLDGTISMVIKKGYKLNGAIIRYPDVIAYKKIN